MLDLQYYEEMADKYLIVLLSGIWSKNGVECVEVIDTKAYGIF